MHITQNSKGRESIKWIISPHPCLRSWHSAASAGKPCWQAHVSCRVHVPVDGLFSMLRNGHKPPTFLHLALHTCCNSEVSLYVHVQLILFNGCMILQCLNIPFSLQISYQRTFWCFQAFAILNNVPMYILTDTRISTERVLEREVLGKVGVHLTFQQVITEEFFV